MMLNNSGSEGRECAFPNVHAVDDDDLEGLMVSRAILKSFTFTRNDTRFNNTRDQEFVSPRFRC